MELILIPKAHVVMISFVYLEHMSFMSILLLSAGDVDRNFAKSTAHQREHHFHFVESKRGTQQISHVPPFFSAKRKQIILK